HWGEPNHPKVQPIRPERFGSERAIFDALSPEAPVLGICYGCQFVNVVRGGSLIQHLPDVVGHEADSGGGLQCYEIDARSKLAGVIGSSRVEGQSWHHQAVGRLGDHLRTVARNADGTIEAIEATDRPWLIGVQWHPERTSEDEATRRLFESFVAAAAEFRARRHRD
ncbi:MAG TPA: gamma-glutamyl-gamma-aminobutyrate hydrolase family protein, partial [Fimbriimonadaceae bacterium]|nr:gamma-glutamyl-gamma-aminobutyrate hydrolase family protein [Fimbriimonadaceae bacterium]